MVGGGASQKITEVWLYVNGDFLGAYTLPATIPILAEGPTDLYLYPGIKENGIAETPGIYDLLTNYRTTVNLTAAKTTEIKPVIDYKSQSEITWAFKKEQTTFDQNGIILEDRDSDPATSFQVTSDGAFGGSGKSVKCYVDTAHAIIAFATTQLVSLPNTTDRQVWLELNYKNDMPFYLSLVGVTTGYSEAFTPVYQFNNSSDWNKIYIKLNDAIQQAPNDQYRLFFQVSIPRDANGKPTQLTGTVYLDNIRLIHF